MQQSLDKNNSGSTIAHVTDAMQKAIKAPSNAVKPQRDIKTAIAEMRPLLAQALPKHLTADRIIQMATNYVRLNPAIGKCTEQSLLGAIMQASLLGLEPVPSLGHCYFVPRKANKGTKESPMWVDEVSFEIGYKGYIKLAHNTKEVKMIYAEAVYENDQFEYEEGVFKKLKHIPVSGNRGAFRGAYAVIHYLNGGYNFKWLDKPTIENRRLRSPNQKNGLKGPWATDYETMAKGKAIKVLLTTEPLSAEVQTAVVTDEAIISDRAFTNNQSGIDIEGIERSDDEWIEDFGSAE